MRSIQDRALTLVTLSLFLVFLAGQILTGWREYNEEARDHGEASTTPRGYFATGHFWEATGENWESAFMQMAAFVMLTVALTQKGSSESRRPGVVELVDLDPRDVAHLPDTPWPVRRGGWILALYERSLGLAFAAMFVISWAESIMPAPKTPRTGSPEAPHPSSLTGAREEAEHAAAAGNRSSL